MTALSKIALILLMALNLSGCGLLDMVTITSVETTRPEEPSTEEPPVLTLVHDNILTPLNRGSYCWTTGSMGMCVDTIPPSYTVEDSVTINAGAPLTLRFDNPVTTNISAELRAGTDLSGASTTITPLVLNDDGSFTFSVDEAGQYVLMVFATWDNQAQGDAFYSLPITVE